MSVPKFQPKYEMSLNNWSAILYGFRMINSKSGKSRNFYIALMTASICFQFLMRALQQLGKAAEV
jgi:hypothetical protein